MKPVPIKSLRIFLPLVICLGWAELWGGNTWDGGSGSNSLWSTSQNWSPNGVPGAWGDVYLDGTTQLTNTNDTNAYYNTYYINSGSGAFDVTSSGGPTRVGVGITNNDNDNQTFNGSLYFYNGATMNAASGDITIAASITSGDDGGTYAFTKTGNNTLTLSGANWYGESTVVSDGILIASHVNSLGTSGTTNTTVASGATLQFQGADPSSENFYIAGTGHSSNGALYSTFGGDNFPIIAGTVTMTADSTLKVDGGCGMYISGVIGDGAGTYDLTKSSDTGWLWLLGNNDYGGATNIEGGIVYLQHEDGLGDPGSTTTTTIASGAQLNLQGAYVMNENFNVAGDGGGTGAIYLPTGKGNTQVGTVTMTADTTVDAVDNFQTLTMGVVDDGAGTYDLIKGSSNGILALSSANTYDGDTIINGGVIRASNANSLGSTTGSTTIASGGALWLIGNITVAEDITMAGNGWLGVGSILCEANTQVLTGDITLNASSKVTSNGGIYFNNTIDDGVGTYGLTTAGTGWVALNADNTYGGATIVSAGSVYVLNEDGLGESTNNTADTTTTVTSGATLSFNNAIAMMIYEDFNISGTGVSNAGAIGVYDGSHTIKGTVTLAGNSQIDVTNSDDTLTFEGAISGISELTKTGAGTMIVSGNNSYTGDTIVSAGTLELGAADRIDNSSDLVLNGGVFSTGGFDETMGNLTLSADSIIDMNDSGGVSDLTFALLNDAAMGTYTLKIYNWDGTVNAAGTSGDDDRLVFSSHSFTKYSQVEFYSDAGSTQVGWGGRFRVDELVPAPEPSTWVGIGLLLGLVVIVERKRRKLGKKRN